jgi:hypothetical protein
MYQEFMEEQEASQSQSYKNTNSSRLRPPPAPHQAMAAAGSRCPHARPRSWPLAADQRWPYRAWPPAADRRRPRGPTAPCPASCARRALLSIPRPAGGEGIIR